MQSKESDTSQNIAKSKNIVVDFDDQMIDFDDISFKPITNGLGFNSNNKKKVVEFKKQVKHNNTNTDFNHEKFAEKIGVPQYLKIKSEPLKPTLKTFNIFDKDDKKIKITEVKEKEIKLASKYKNLCAWALDILIIIFVISTVLFGFQLTPGIEAKKLITLFNTEEILTFLIGLFSVIYLIYFSVLDYFTTPGKYLLKTKLTKSNNQYVTATDCIIRSTASMLSFLALGIPFLMDFQGKLSDTKIVVR